MIVLEKASDVVVGGFYFLIQNFPNFYRYLTLSLIVFIVNNCHRSYITHRI